jgi:hypothetical protein
MTTEESAGASATFDTTLSGSGNKAGIVVPEAVIAELGAGKRPSVLINLNGHEYRSTVAVMGGAFMVGVSADIRAKTGLEVGDAIHVTLTVATQPRDVNIPDDFDKAMAATPGTRTFFDSLANSLQRYHIDNVNGAKTAETRQRRIEKAVALFAAGKKR